MIRDVHPEFGIFFHPGSGFWVQVSKKAQKHRIPDQDPQNWYL